MKFYIFFSGFLRNCRRSRHPVSDTFFIEQPPLCYQPLVFYGKIPNLSFWENFENSTPIIPPPLYKDGSSNYVSSIIKFEYELPHQLPDNLRLGTLGNQEMTMKSQVWVESQASVQSLLQKVISVNRGQTATKKRYQSFLVLSIFS